VAHGTRSQGSPLPRWRRIFALPSTKEGWRALWLVAAGFALAPIAALLVRIFDASAFGVLGAVGVLAIIAGGVYAVIAVFRRGERSLFSLAMLLLGLFALIFVIGEFASPH
jgi:hypothetical protein